MASWSSSSAPTSSVILAAEGSYPRPAVVTPLDKIKPHCGERRWVVEGVNGASEDGDIRKWAFVGPNGLGEFILSSALRPARAMDLSGEDGTLKNLSASRTTYLPVNPEAPKIITSYRGLLLIGCMI
ncbi:hypothetical protein PIB30_010879 [Stylosanthes scabra]|uniref:Uncharacterized protein n=1 Tax=Stylosanthes scabra TaxID=79078 RepID=A0ABU6S5M4_9FABA|nr:hypothetical protein [Stylosanthes scabra]